MKATSFKRKVWKYYEENGRHDLPWRKTNDPYKILVSEIMLQQTQVDRCIDYYKRFLKRFPTVRSLAKAPLSEVLVLWSGLGYNRRAKFLHECAKVVVRDRKGNIPENIEELLTLPGVGAYTAGAIRAFSFDKPGELIETNIRTALLHEFFPTRDEVDDKELIPLLKKLVQTVDSPRTWYWALMDYGAYIKKEFGNHNARSKHYTKQAPLKGSNREVRGGILKILKDGSATTAALQKETTFASERLVKALISLEEEGMIKRKGRSWVLA